jgi:hypothetical protein
MNIAFIGGCLNRQRNLSPDEHYHAIVRRGLVNNTGVNPAVGLYFYSSYHQLHRKAQVVLNGDTNYDCLVLFIRAYTLIPLTKLFIRYTDKQMQNKVGLHPKYAGTPYYNLMAEEYKVPVAKVRDGVFQKTFQEFNNFAGDMLGLPEWAVEEVIAILKDIHLMALERKIKLVIAGPILYPAVDRINNVCIELNRRVTIFAALNGIPHIDLAKRFDSDGNQVLGDDLKHLTAFGHSFMAEQILGFINEPQTTSAPVPNPG